jgi:drug/metabolite transporter (DMT)-like permease
MVETGKEMTGNKRLRTIAIASLLASSIIIGFSYVVLKTGLEYASPFAILVDRLLIAAFVIFLLKKTGVIKIDKISAGQKGKLFLLSQLYPIAFFLFQNFGIRQITASEASILYSLIPIFTTIASAIVLKEKTTPLQKLGILLSFGGMAYISFRSFDGFSDSVTGYILIFCSMFSMVLYYVFLKKNVANISTLSVTYYLLLFAVLSSVVVYLGYELITFHTLPGLQRLEHHNYIMAILYLGVLSTLGTSLFTTIGIKYLSAVQASIFSNISPFFGILAGILIMGDILEAYQIIGAACIFTGMFISLKYTTKNPR